MTGLLRFLVIVLAAKFLAILFTEEDGPFGAARLVRVVAGAEPPSADDTIPAPVSPGFWADVLSCYRCFSPYGALLATVLYALYRPLAETLAAAGAVIWLMEMRPPSNDD